MEHKFRRFETQAVYLKMICSGEKKRHFKKFLLFLGHIIINDFFLNPIPGVFIEDFCVVEFVKACVECAFPGYKRGHVAFSDHKMAVLPPRTGSEDDLLLWR